MKKNLNREKVNFMISKEILMQFRQLIPAGERSDFMNETLEEALTQYSRKKASEAMDKMVKDGVFAKLSTKGFLKTRHNGLL
jgi:ABC-type amino acid transport substrate-binding protein